MKRALPLLILTLLLGLQFSSASNARDEYLRSPRLGINHISGVEEDTSDERYQKALELGAGWNRWPLYWSRVETAPGEFEWSGYDRLVREDLAHGLSINAILLGKPEFYRDGTRMKGLQLPIFADGSDTPREGKAINPDNPWARFVVEAVQRYKPGGALAQELGWSDDEGIRLWEIWNEPDHKPFWEASILDYARLLKTAYILIKWIDPEAQVMFGGLLFATQDNWLAWVLAIYEDDPLREQYNWYMDAVAVHNYTYPWRSGWLVKWVKQTLIAYELERPIWLNESGTPVWDDYPGRIWSEQPEEKQLYSTAAQQARFFIQSSAYAWAEGAEVVFYHQLYDDCGNQPGGTNFRFHYGEMCLNGALCSGDAFGLYRNEANAVCFSHHPLPGTPRPAALAYRLVADLFGQGRLTNPVIQTIDNRATVIRFDKPDRRERLYVVWNNSLDPVTLQLAVGDKAVMRYSLTEKRLMTPDDDGLLAIDLPPADCDYFPFLNDVDLTAVGGTPYIIVGSLHEDDTPPDLQQPVISPRTRCG